MLHPLVAVHPETGRKLLYVSELTTTHIEGLREKESNALLKMLFEHIDWKELHCRFYWEKNSIAMWDNRCTVHYAVGDYDEPREMHRVTVIGKAAVGAPSGASLRDRARVAREGVAPDGALRYFLPKRESASDFAAVSAAAPAASKAPGRGLNQSQKLARSLSRTSSASSSRHCFGRARSQDRHIRQTWSWLRQAAHSSVRPMGSRSAAREAPQRQHWSSSAMRKA